METSALSARLDWEGVDELTAQQAPDIARHRSRIDSNNDSSIYYPLGINIFQYYRLIASDPRRIVAFFTSNDAIGTIILPGHYNQRIGGPGNSG